MKTKKSFLQITWDIVFTLFYPIITLFSLLFMGLIFILSATSRLISYVLPKSKSFED